MRVKFTVLLIILFLSPRIFAQKYAPYINFIVEKQKTEELQLKVEQALKSKNFVIEGHYSPADNPDNILVLFSRQSVSTKIAALTPQRFMAQVHRVAIYPENGKMVVSLLNPEYLFYAFLQNDALPLRSAIKQFSDDAVSALKTISSDKTETGGLVEYSTLINYAYRQGQPTFADVQLVAQYDNFDQGYQKVFDNLQARKNRTILAYSVVDKQRKVALFGVGLQNIQGEHEVLKAFGNKYMAALPFELIIIDNKAYMLHLRYRLPLFCPAAKVDINAVMRKLPASIETLLKKIAEP